MSHGALNIDGPDPVFSLIERDREAYKAVNEADISDEEMSRRMDDFTEGWWKLVETPPTTIGGAIAQATHVAELAAGETRPTRRGPDCNEENGASLALLGIAKFLQSVNNGA